jgi:hypothetical protein
MPTNDGFSAVTDLRFHSDVIEVVDDLRQVVMLMYTVPNNVVPCQLFFHACMVWVAGKSPSSSISPSK